MINPMQILTMLPQLRSNPIGFLNQRGISVPNNMTDPNQIVQYLMNSGKVSQDMYNTARQMAQGLGVR